MKDYSYKEKIDALNKEFNEEKERLYNLTIED